MEANKEIVDWFSFAGPHSSIASSHTTSMKRQPHEKINPEVNSKLCLLRKAISETRAESIALGKEILKLTSKLHIGSQFLPNDIKEGLRRMVLIAKSEKLPGFDETALLICRERKKIHEKTLQQQERQLKKKYEIVVQKYTNLQKQLSYVQETVSSVECAITTAQVELKSECPTVKLLCSKMANYENAIKKLEDELRTLNVTELKPDKIIGKHESLMKLKGLAAQLNNDLRQYGDLPPSLFPAKAVVEDKEMEYKKAKRILEETY